MKFYREADKLRVGCQHCRAMKEATMQLRDVPFNKTNGIARDILVAVCDTCGNIASVPQQSTIKIGKDLNKVKKSIELRVPAHYIDMLNMASYKIDRELDDSFNKHLVLYYLHSLNVERYDSSDLVSLISKEEKNIKSTKRLSFKAGDRALSDVSDLLEKHQFKNRSDLFKSIILKINNDIVQTKKPKNIEELKALASAFSG